MHCFVIKFQFLARLNQVFWKSVCYPGSFESEWSWLASFSPPLLMRQSQGVRSLEPLCNVTLLTQLYKTHSMLTITKQELFPSHYDNDTSLFLARLEWGEWCAVLLYEKWKDRLAACWHVPPAQCQDLLLQMPSPRLQVFAARRTRSPSQFCARPPCRFAAPSHRITSAILTLPSIMHKNNWGQASTQA